MDEEADIDNGSEEEIKRLMEEYDIDEDTAWKAQQLIDEGVEADEAIELADEM